MGRPEAPIERDGTPVREFAFWLRDLRSRAGLTYAQVAKAAHYATSTVQDAASGRALPTLRVVRAYVAACGGDIPAWEAYWAQIRRLIDPGAPVELSRSVEPPWARMPAPGRGAAVLASDAPEGWYLHSLTALLRLDTEPIEAVEQRVVVATVDGLSEIATSISVPRDRGDNEFSHRLEAELLHGGALERREQPYESFFRNVVALPSPLRAGEQHEYALRFRIPAEQPMASHYAHLPLQRSDHCDIRVRFDRDRLPRRVWKLAGVPTAVLYQASPAGELMTPDRFGEVHVEFSDMRPGLSYGVSWDSAEDPGRQS